MHIHYYKDGNALPNPPDLKKGDPLYEKHKRLFRGLNNSFIAMNELYELISHYHDAEFEYNGTTYVLQPEIEGGKSYLAICDCTPDAEKRITKRKIKVAGDIPKSVIDAVLSKTCFRGKSFLEIEHEITVTVIY